MSENLPLRHDEATTVTSATSGPHTVEAESARTQVSSAYTLFLEEEARSLMVGEPNDPQHAADRLRSIERTMGEYRELGKAMEFRRECERLGRSAGLPVGLGGTAEIVEAESARTQVSSAYTLFLEEEARSLMVGEPNDPQHAADRLRSIERTMGEYRELGKAMEFRRECERLGRSAGLPVGLGGTAAVNETAGTTSTPDEVHS